MTPAAMANEASVKDYETEQDNRQTDENISTAAQVECDKIDTTDHGPAAANTAGPQQRSAAPIDINDQEPCGTYTTALGVEDIGRLVASHLPLVFLVEAERASKLTGASLNSGGQRPRGTYCLLYTSPSPRDATLSRMPSSA